MKKFFAGFVTILALSTPALAQQVGPLPVTALRGTGTGGCAKFQVGGAGPWYGLINSQMGFEQNFSLLLTAATTGQQVTFTLSGTMVCGVADVGGVEIGVEH
jgi:hypothetical protein